LSHAGYNALGEMPVSKTANEVTEEMNRSFWWKNMEKFNQSKGTTFKCLQTPK
jgi:hypothetical protein